MGERMPRVFVSQPMRGYSEEDILRERERALKAAKYYLGVDEVVEIPSYIPQIKDKNPVQCIGASVSLMADADLVIFCRGWYGARGCRVEHAVASEYGLEYKEI